MKLGFLMGAILFIFWVGLTFVDFGVKAAIETAGILIPFFVLGWWTGYRSKIK